MQNYRWNSKIDLIDLALQQPLFFVKTSMLLCRWWSYFIDDDNITGLQKFLRIHGKVEEKYDDVRIGVNLRFNTIQATVLKVKRKK